MTLRQQLVKVVTDFQVAALIMSTRGTPTYRALDVEIDSPNIVASDWLFRLSILDNKLFDPFGPIIFGGRRMRPPREDK